MKEGKNEAKIKELEQKIEELSSNWKRALADYQNLEKRMSSQNEEAREFATSIMFTKILPIFDNLLKASELLKDQGLVLIVKQLKDLLDAYQVKRFGDVGEDFNPEFYEAVAIDETAAENKIVEVFSHGYLIKGRLLRPAAVKVGRK